MQTAKQFLTVGIYVFVLSLFSCCFCQSLEAKTSNQFFSKAIRTSIADIEKSRDIKKRIAAARLLGYHATPESIEALAIALIKDENARVRDGAARSLWKLGKKAVAAQKQLTVALQDSDPGVRVRVSWALQVQGVDVKDLAEVRRSVLADEKSDVVERFWAAKGLVKLDNPSILIDPILEYSKNHIRSKAAENALKQLVNRQDKNIVTSMFAMVADFHPGNGIILGAMEGFTPLPDNIVQRICQQLSYDNDELTEVILFLLAKHTKQAEEVSYWLPLVKHYTINYKFALRLAAVRLIGRAGSLAIESLPEIVQVMRNDEKAQMRRKAIEAIANMGNKTKSHSATIKNKVADVTLKDLILVIKTDTDQRTRLTGLRCLDKLQTRAVDVIPVLVYVALNDNYTPAKVSALQILAGLGREAAPAVVSIKKLLNHPDKAVRQKAQWALQAIEKGNSQITQVLPPPPPKKKSGQQQAMVDSQKDNSSFDERSLMLACTSANIGKIKKYLDSGISADYRFVRIHNKPMLSMIFARTTMYAKRNKKTPAKIKDITRLLLDRGADPNIADKMGNTPLMNAAMGCDEELLQILLDAGADPHAISKSGLTALEYALSFGNKGITALIKAGSRLSAGKATSYRKAYANNPAMLALINQATVE